MSRKWENIRFGFLVIGLLVCLAPFVLALQQSPRIEQNVTELKTWRLIHQAVDDAQGRQIIDLTAALADMRARDSERLARLEAQTAALSADLGSLSNRVWALLVAVFIQIVGVVAPRVKQFSRKSE